MKTEHHNCTPEGSRIRSFQRIFLTSAIVILAIMALGKLISADWTARASLAANPLLMASLLAAFLSHAPSACLMNRSEERSALRPRILRCRPVGRLILLVIGALAAGWHTDASAIEIEGNMRSTAYNPHTGEAFQHLSFRFKIAAAQGKWSIRIIDDLAEAGKRDGAQVLELAFDGRDLYGLTHFSDEMANKFSKKDRVRYPREQGQVSEAAGFPLGGDPIQKCLWLAYCSSHYLADLKTNQMPSVSALLPAAHPVRVTYSLLEGASSLPRSFEEYAPGTRLDIVKGRMTHIVCPPPFDKEYLAMRYTVDQTTHLDADNIYPVSFRAEYFMPVGEGSNANNALVRVQVGEVTSINGTVPDDVRPAFSEAAIIHDHRFRELTGETTLRYDTVEKGRSDWLDRDSPDLLEKIHAKARRAPERAGARANARWWAIIPIIFVFSLPLVLWGMRALRTKTLTPHKE